VTLLFGLMRKWPACRHGHSDDSSLSACPAC
jgi:hypothetical protein